MTRLATSGSAANRTKPMNHGETKPQNAATSLGLRFTLVRLALDSRRHDALRDVALHEHEEDDRRKRVQRQRQARHGSSVEADGVRDPGQQRSVRVEQEEEILRQVVA